LVVCEDEQVIGTTLLEAHFIARLSLTVKDPIGLIEGRVWSVKRGATMEAGTLSCASPNACIFSACASIIDKVPASKCACMTLQFRLLRDPTVPTSI
jgi:hypothetical protein